MYYFSHVANEENYLKDFFHHPDILNHPALPIIARQGRDFIAGKGKSLARQFLYRQDESSSQMGVSIYF